jgi:predicted PurR-regulated permease PerM
LEASDKTHHFNNNNKKKKKNVIAAAATLLTFAAILVILSSMATTPVAATTTGNTTTTTTTTTSSSLGIELSPQPVYQEQEKLESLISINQTHSQITVSGNGTLTLPNATETIRITSTRSGIASIIDSDFVGKAIWTTEDGSESAIATIYELVRFNM